MESPLLPTLLSVLSSQSVSSKLWQGPSHSYYSTVKLVHRMIDLMLDWLPGLMERLNTTG